MNNNLQTALAELITKANQGADTAAEFLINETPEIIQQLMVWNAVMSILGAIVSALLIWTVGTALWHFHRETDDPLITFMAGGTAMVLCMPIIVFVLRPLDWLQIWLAPKVWLVEYASQLVK